MSSRPGLKTDSDVVLAQAAATGLLELGRPVLVMLSGGRDSVCLLDIATRLLGHDMVEALHVNYRLRAEADIDQDHCQKLCEELKVKLHTAYPEELGPVGNLQAWARAVRYTKANELADARSAVVAVGHTADDQVETVLYRLATSPGRNALLGMRDRRGRIVRPLLDCRRSQVTDYCRARGLSWREDASNLGTAFARGRVRNELIPALEQIHPAAKENILRTLKQLRQEAELLDELACAALGKRQQLPLKELAEIAPALRPLVIRQLAQQSTGADGSIRLDAVEELLALKGKGGTNLVELGAGLNAVIEYDQLRIEPRSSVVGDLAQPATVVLPVPGSVSFGRYAVSATVMADPVPDEGVVDAAKLIDSLSVRTVRSGDSMAPLGMGGHTKKLQDLLTDRRVPRLLRASLPVVSCGEEIVWVPGVATSERFKLTPESRSGVVLRATLDGDSERDLKGEESSSRWL